MKGLKNHFIVPPNFSAIKMNIVSGTLEDTKEVNGTFVVRLHSKLSAKVKETKSSDGNGRLYCRVWATGTVVQEWNLEKQERAFREGEGFSKL